MSRIASDTPMRTGSSRPRALIALTCALALGVAIAGCSYASSSTTQTSSTRSELGASVLETGSTGSASTTTALTGTSATSASTTQPLPGAGKPSLVIGDKNFTEQFILGELYYQALLAEGFDVSMTQNIGTTSVSMQAIAAHTLDMYPEYLNVILSQVAHVPRSFRHLHPAWEAAQAWAKAHGLTLLPPTPFSDTAGLGVRSTYAFDHDLVTLYGLRRVAASMTIGAPPEFQTGPGGLPTLEQTYGFLPARVQTVNIGAQYSALSAGDVQAAYVQTTDGQLSNPAYTVLADPHHAFGFGNVVPVISSSTLAAEGGVRSVFARTIEKVDSLLNIEVMRQLNAEVDLDLETPTSVARQFLEQQGLIPPGS